MQMVHSLFKPLNEFTAPYDELFDTLLRLPIFEDGDKHDKRHSTMKKLFGWKAHEPPLLRSTMKKWKEFIKSGTPLEEAMTTTFLKLAGLAPMMQAKIMRLIGCKLMALVAMTWCF